LREYDANKAAFLSGPSTLEDTTAGLCCKKNCIPDVSLSRLESSGLTSDTGAAIQLVDFTLWSWRHPGRGFGFVQTLIMPRSDFQQH